MVYWWSRKLVIKKLIITFEEGNILSQGGFVEGQQNSPVRVKRIPQLGPG